jgi:hypothetical protein
LNWQSSETSGDKTQTPVSHSKEEIHLLSY